jgi:hypothetical protein
MEREPPQDGANLAELTQRWTRALGNDGAAQGLDRLRSAVGQLATNPHPLASQAGKNLDAALGAVVLAAREPAAQAKHLAAAYTLLATGTDALLAYIEAAGREELGDAGNEDLILQDLIALRRHLAAS